MDSDTFSLWKKTEISFNRIILQIMDEHEVDGFMNPWLKTIGYGIGSILIIGSLTFTFLALLGSTDAAFMQELAYQKGVLLQEMYWSVYLGIVFFVLPFLIAGIAIVMTVYRRQKRDLDRQRWEEYNKTVLPELPGVYSQGYRYDIGGARIYEGFAILCAVIAFFFSYLLFLLAFVLAIVTIFKGEVRLGFMTLFVCGMFFFVGIVFTAIL